MTRYNYVNLYPDSLCIVSTCLHRLQETVPSGNPSDCCVLSLLKGSLFANSSPIKCPNVYNRPITPHLHPPFGTTAPGHLLITSERTVTDPTAMYTKYRPKRPKHILL